MNQIHEVIRAGANFAQGILARISGAERKSQGLPVISSDDPAQFGCGRALRVVPENGVQSASLNNVNDIEPGHRFMFGGGIPDDALVYPLVDSIEAVLAVDPRALVNGFKRYIVGAHIYSPEVVQGLNERILDAARMSAARLSYSSSPDSLETCAVISFVATCVKYAWFTDTPDGLPLVSTQLLADEFWSQRRRGTGKTYSVLKMAARAGAAITCESYVRNYKELIASFVARGGPLTAVNSDSSIAAHVACLIVAGDPLGQVINDRGFERVQFAMDMMRAHADGVSPCDPTSLQEDVLLSYRWGAVRLLRGEALGFVHSLREAEKFWVNGGRALIAHYVEVSEASMKAFRVEHLVRHVIERGNGESGAAPDTIAPPRRADRAGV